MKVSGQVNQIARGGVKERIVCTMSANSFAFQTLARQYSNPIKAIVQEISANAADSHFRAKKTSTPFNVKLPTTFDPHFRVRDFGVSMDEEKIRNVYSVYMASDKRQSNDETGCYGLGSKTPLAYTDSFNIVTYLNGVMTMYSLGYNEEGIPELNVFGSFPTDEQDGVEISLAVNEKDFSRFVAAANEVYRFFDVPVVVDGKLFKNNIRETFSYTGKDYGLSTLSENVVVMGNIGYIIKHRPDSLPYNINGIVLYVPVGSVDLVPSREDLEYSDKTNKYLHKRISELKKEFLDNFKKDIENSNDSYFKIVSQFDTIKNKYYGFLPDVINAKDNKFGIDINGEHLANTIKQKCNHSISYQSIRRGMGDRAIILAEVPQFQYIRKFEDTVIYFCDREKYNDKIAKKIRHDASMNYTNIHGRFIGIKFGDKDTVLEELYAHESDFILIDALSLPDVPNNTVKIDKFIYEVREYNLSATGQVKYDIKKLTRDEIIKEYGKEIPYAYRFYGRTQINSTLIERILRGFKIAKLHCVIVDGSDRPRVEKKDKNNNIVPINPFISLSDYIKRIVEAELKKPNFINIKDMLINNNQVIFNYASKTIIKEIKNKRLINQKVVDIFNKEEELIEASKRLSEIEWICAFLSIKTDMHLQKEYNGLIKMCKEFEKDHPFLYGALCHADRILDDDKKVRDFVSLINSI